MKAGVSIGVHKHIASEEIYYLISGSGILTYDDVEYEMQPGIFPCAPWDIHTAFWRQTILSSL